MSKLAKLKATGGAAAAESLGKRKGKGKADVAAEIGPKLADVDRRFAGVESAGTAGSIPVDRIEADPSQPRKYFDPSELKELAESIRRQGQIQPAGVYWVEAAGKYRLIFGERRWRACVAAGIRHLECKVWEEPPAPGELPLVQLAENVQRSNFRPMEEARAYKETLAKLAITGKELAGRLGVDPARITRLTALLDTAPTVQRLVESEELSPAGAYELSKIKNQGRQSDLALEAVQGGWSRETVRERVKELNDAGKKPKAGKGGGTPAPAAAVVDSAVNREGVFTRFAQYAINGTDWNIAIKHGRGDDGRHHAVAVWWIKGRPGHHPPLTTRETPHPTADDAMQYAAEKAELAMIEIGEEEAAKALRKWVGLLRTEWSTPPSAFDARSGRNPGEGGGASIAPRNSEAAEIGIAVKGSETFSRAALEADRFGCGVTILADPASGHDVKVHADDLDAEMTSDEVTAALKSALARWLYHYGRLALIETRGTVSARSHGVPSSTVIDRNVVITIDELVTILVDPADGRESYQRILDVDQLDPPAAPVVETTPDGGAPATEAA